MGKGTIAIRGGGGSSKEAYALIRATYPIGSSCTCSNGKKTLFASGSTGVFIFPIPEAGTWTLKITDGTETASRAVEITTKGQIEKVALAYGFMLYEPGNEHISATGGWTAVAMARTSGGSTAKPTITQDSTGMAMTCSKGGVVRTKNKIDLTDYTTLYFEGDLRTSGSRSDWMRLCVWSSMGTLWTDNLAAQLTSANTEPGQQTLDVSGLSGAHYIGYGIYASAAHMERLYLE